MQGDVIAIIYLIAQNPISNIDCKNTYFETPKPNLANKIILVMKKSPKKA